MAGPDGISSSNSVTLEGRTLSGPATGPAIDRYRTAGGVYTEIYNDVGRRLGTTNEATILREIHRQYDAQTVGQQSAQETAASIVNGARESSIFGNSINTEQIAARILEIRRDNPGQAAEIERQIFAQLSDAGDQSRLSQDISTAVGHVSGADARIASLGSEAAPATGPVIGRAALTARSNALIEASTDRVGPHRGNPRGSETLNVHELAYQVEQIAAENPRLAQVLRADLTTRLGAADAATFNRVLAGDTGFGEGIGRALAHPVDGAIGAGKGIANGFIALGDLMARGSTMQAAADQQQAAAFASLFGNEQQAAAHQELAEGLRTVAGSEMIPQIPYSNIAQSGGGDVGTVVDVAMAGKGIVTGGARLLARNADEIAGVAGRFSDRILDASRRTGIAPDVIDRIIATDKALRPDVTDYVSPARLAEHARAFENGGSRFTLQSSLNKYGLGQTDGTTFILPRAEADRIMAMSGGDPRRLEAALGLPNGQLDSASLVRVDFSPEALDDLGIRMPNGREAGANEQWLPGGILPSGTDEAVIDGGRAAVNQYSVRVVE